MMSSNKYLVLSFIALVSLIEYSVCGFMEDMKKFPCYTRKYQLKKFYCENEFFISFRDRPFQSCSDKAAELGNCFSIVNEECLLQADSKSSIYKIYAKYNKKRPLKETKKDYCHNAGLVTPFLGGLARRTLGCTLDFYIGKATCINDFRKKWRHNRSNKLLCNEYYAMKKCINEEMASHCSVLAIERMGSYKSKFLSKLHLDLNPFCIHKLKLFR